jgi:dCTP diphosphatase
VEPQAGSLAALTMELRRFAEERDWEQFHVPRSLLLALQGEVGEVAELLQWVRDDEVDAAWLEAHHESLSDELADVLLYLLRLADVCGVSLGAAAEYKMRKNAIRYPISISKGSAVKRLRLED